VFHKPKRKKQEMADQKKEDELVRLSKENEALQGENKRLTVELEEAKTKQRIVYIAPPRKEYCQKCIERFVDRQTKCFSCGCRVLSCHCRILRSEGAPRMAGFHD
jgi:hypothetical protein